MIKYDGGARRVRQAEPVPDQPATAHEPATSRAGLDTASLAGLDTSWRDTARLPLKKTAHILGISVASVYRLNSEGRLEFRRLAGRTLVVTAGVAALVDSDEDQWTPSSKGVQARAKRAEIAKAAWQEYA